MEFFVDHFCYSLGNITKKVEESAAEGLVISPPEVLRDSGFFQHHVCSPDRSAYDLARDCVQQIQPALSNVGAIVYSTCIPANSNLGNDSRYRETRDVKYLMDFPVSHLQRDFGLDHATVIGLTQQACTGMLGSLRLARGLLSAEPDLQAVLCLSSDRFPEGALYEQAYSLISDGASACIVSRNPSGFRFLVSHAVTNGALSAASDDETVGTFFNYACGVIRDTLNRARLTPDQIDFVVSQNMNPSAWNILSRLLGIDYKKVQAPGMKEVAHVISGDNIINLKMLLDAGKIQSGQRVLLFMAGYGLNWQCVILQRV